MWPVQITHTFLRAWQFPQTHTFINGLDIQPALLPLPPTGYSTQWPHWTGIPKKQRPHLNHIITFFYSHRPPYNPWKTIWVFRKTHPKPSHIMSGVLSQDTHKYTNSNTSTERGNLIFVPIYQSSITTVLHSIQDDKVWTHIYLLSFWDF